MRSVFLDRDGVLNHAVLRNGKPHPPQSEDEVRVYDDAHEALNRLKVAGYKLIVVTNQPDVARGAQTRSQTELISRRVCTSLPIDDVLTCYHDDADACECRKPKPGLLLQAASKHNVDLPASYMVGDRWRDVEAGARAGCTTVWINRGYAEQAPESPSATVKSLSEAVDFILSR